MALAVVNAIPDFHQDRLVGKRNLVVRLGRRRAVSLYLALAAAGFAGRPDRRGAGHLPDGCLAALLGLPLLVASGRSRMRTYESPREFVPAVRSIVACYMVAVLLFTGGILLHGCRRDEPHRSAARRRCSSRGRSRATATSAACIAAPNRRRASGCRTSSTPPRRCELADEIVAHRRALRDALRRRAAGRAAFPRRRRSARPRGRRAQDRDQRPALRCEARRAARPPAHPIHPDQPRRRHAGRLRAPAARAHRSPRRTRRAAPCARPASRSRSRSRRPGSTFTRPSAVIERARALGAFRFNTGRLMRIGTAARLWDKLEPTARAVRRLPRLLARLRLTLRRRAGALPRAVRCRRRAARKPRQSAGDAARLPNGWVKVAAALPHVCADLRRDPLGGGVGGLPQRLEE